MTLTLLPFAMLPCAAPPPSTESISHTGLLSVGKYLNRIWFQWFSIKLKMFFMAMVSVYLSVLSFASHLSSALLFVLSLPDPGPSSQAMGFGIYDPVSDTYPESYPQRASLYLKRCLCSFPELSEHSLKDLVLRHCNSLFLMFLMCIPRHPGSLFIFPSSCFWASPPSPLLCCPLAWKQTLLPW